MKLLAGLIALALIIVGGNVLTEVFRNMNPDALGIGVGLLLGIMAGLTSGLLLIIVSGGAGRGGEHNPEPAALGRRYEFSFVSEPAQPAQRQPETVVTPRGYLPPAPVVYYLDETGDDWALADFPKLAEARRSTP